MKKIILIFSLIGVITFIYWYSLTIIEKEAISYVTLKDEQLKKEFYDNLDEAFIDNSRMMYSEEYTGADYTPIDMKAVRKIDERVEKIPSESIIERLFPPYGRYHKELNYLFMMYQPGSFKDLDEMYAVKKIPWEALLLKRMDKKTLKLFRFIPVAVGYRKVESFLKSWRPSLDECCKGTLDYLINEDKDYSTCYNPSNKRKVAEVLKYYNRYYYLQRGYIDYSASNFRFENFERSKTSDADWYYNHQFSNIYNGYYRVYYDIIPSVTYNVKFNSYNYKLDKEKFYNKYRQIATIIYCILFIPLTIFLFISVYSFSKSKSDKIKQNGMIIEDISELYNKVISASNPQQFIEPYNPKKLSIANEIYAKAIENKEDIQLLKKLWKRIEIELL